MTAGRRLCLNMIVKDEAHVIRRCLASVCQVIDYWVIVDTGSTDGTQDIIRDFFAARGIPGELHERAWVDFAHNRSEALELARPHAGYSMIIDADDTLEAAYDFDRFKLTANSYTVDIRYGGVAYRRTQLVRNALPWTWRGVLHEFLTCGEEAGPPGHAELTMYPAHEGARSRDPDTYKKDVAVLERALETETDPFLRSRYTFYLAQSYKDAGQQEKAVARYLERAELGFWEQERFVGLLAAARLQEALERPLDEIVATYQRAIEIAPNRAEALHGLARLLRINDRSQEAVGYAERGLAIPPPPDGLFVERGIYDHGMLDEFAIAAYWAGRHRDSLDANIKLLEGEALPAGERARVARNARFALDRLPPPPNLGRLGQEDFVDQHALAPHRKLRTRLMGAPPVLVAILAKQKEHWLPLYLSCIEALDYPKSSIFLHVRTNNSTDRTKDILTAWLDRVGPLYAGVEFDASDVAEPVQQFGVHEWNPKRFRVLGAIRNASLAAARRLGCDFYFVADVDSFVRRSTLRELVALNLPIVAPLLRTVSARPYYSNYHAETDANGYYQDSDQYRWILNRWVRGVIEAPVVHTAYVVRTDASIGLTYDDGSGRSDYVIFSESARKLIVPQYIDNREIYGYVAFDEGSNLYVEGAAETVQALLAAAGG